MVSKEKIILLASLLSLFLVIFFIPVEHEEQIRIIAGTRTDWGDQGTYCEQFYTSESEIISNDTKTITWKKSYCTI